MGYLAWTVRRLSPYTQTTRSNSDAIDIRDSIKIQAMLKVTALTGASPALVVAAEHSIDNLHWQSLTGLNFDVVTAPGIQTRTATANAFRYLRFAFNLIGTDPTATFELLANVLTRSQDPTSPNILVLRLTLPTEELIPFSAGRS